MTTSRRSRALGATACVVLALAVATPVTSASATSMTLTSPRIAAIVVRALAYDRRLRERAGTRADLLVLTSAERAGAEAAVFARLDSVAVQGLPLLVSTATPTNADHVRELVRARHAEAVFVDDLDPAFWPALREVARERGVIVFAGQRDALDSAAQVAIVDDGERARIVVSLPELRAARVELSADLLKLAEVLR
jgi:hypothetical protein